MRPAGRPIGSKRTTRRTAARILRRAILVHGVVPPARNERSWLGTSPKTTPPHSHHIRDGTRQDGARPFGAVARALPRGWKSGQQTGRRMTSRSQHLLDAFNRATGRPVGPHERRRATTSTRGSARQAGGRSDLLERMDRCYRGGGRSRGHGSADGRVPPPVTVEGTYSPPMWPAAAPGQTYACRLGAFSRSGGRSPGDDPIQPADGWRRWRADPCERLARAAHRPALKDRLPDLVRLRITAFRELPASAARSLRGALPSDLRQTEAASSSAPSRRGAVGASTGLPLAREPKASGSRFARHGLTSTACYTRRVGPPARLSRPRVGVRFFEEREEHVRH